MTKCFSISMAIAVFLLFAIDGISTADDKQTSHQEGLRQNAPAVFCLTQATIHVAPGKIIEDASVLIQGTKITRVGQFDAPAGSKVIDLSGKHLYAGLIDMYHPYDATYEPLEGEGYWNARVRPQRNLAEEFANAELDLEAMRDSGFTMALLVPSEGIVRGTSAAVLLDDSYRQNQIVKPAVAQHLHITLRRRGSGYPNSPMGAYALARQTFYDAGWYRDAWQVATSNAAVERPETNSSLASLQSVLRGEMPVMIDASNELFVLRADRFAREFGLKLMIKGNGNEYRRLDDIAKLSRPIVLPIAFPKAPNVASPEASMNVSLESLLHWDFAPENPGRLHKAGVEFAITSDGLKKKSEFLEHLRLAVIRGLDPQEALAAVTTVPAKLMGVDDQAGTIQQGRLANLMITDGDLFKEETKVLETWVAGKRFQKSPQPVRDIAGKWQVDSPSLGERILELELNDGEWSAEFASDKEDEDDGEEKDAADNPKPELEDLELTSGTLLNGAFRSDQFGLPGAIQMSMTFLDDETSIGQFVLPSGEIEEATGKKLTADDDQEKDGTDGKEAQGSRKKKESKGKRNQPATFEVNYPLGGYGVWGQPSQPRLLITNVTIWTCGPAGNIESGAVLIENGKVAKVFNDNDPLPEVENTIDGNGMHLTPGIIDCHSHMATDSGVNESGQANTAEVRIGDFVDCDDINIYRQLAGGVTAVNILHGSANPIGGQNQVIKLRWGANNEAMKFSAAPAGIKFALGENVKGSNRSTRTDRYPQTRMGVEQFFHDAFRAAKEYRQKHADWKTKRQGLPPRIDLELECIAEIVEGSRWVHCHSYRQDEILALIRVLDRYDIQIGTFQHILEGYKVADEMAKHGAMGSAFADWWAYKYEVIDGIPYAGALMHDAGVVVSFNSDDRELARHLNHEAVKAVRYGGVSEIEALKFVTLNPAKQLRIDQHVGSIEIGKDADMVLWSGHPLSNMSRCEQTWVDGRKYFDRSQEESKRQQIAEMRQTLIQKILTGGEDMANVGEENFDWASLWPRHDEFCHKNHDHRDDE